MHRIATLPGGWTPDTDGVVYIEQTPAPIVVLTAADTDIQTLSAALNHLPDDFPAVRAASLLQLQQQLTIDTYAEEVLSQAQVIIVRLLGGRAYWSYGLEVLQELAQRPTVHLIILPGDDGLDPELMSLSTVPLWLVNTLWRYFSEGGVDNFANGLQLLGDRCLGITATPPPPKTVPRVGVYTTDDTTGNTAGDTTGDTTGSTTSDIPNHASLTVQTDQFPRPKSLPNLGNAAILFYRSHFLSGNLQPIQALMNELRSQGIQPIAIYLSSLRDPEVREILQNLFASTTIDLILNTTGFSLAKLDGDQPDVEFWQTLNLPVFQVILSGGTRDQWQNELRGLTPRDVAMNVALPEVDGRIISRAISFKQEQEIDDRLETSVIRYQAEPSRIQFVSELTKNWLILRKTPTPQRKIALILANYPNKDARLANGVGLDTPASCIEILKALQAAGYDLTDIPASGDELIDRLTAGVTNDPEGRAIRQAFQHLSLTDYQAYFATLPETVRSALIKRWGEPGQGREGEFQNEFQDEFKIAGIQLGNVFVGVQPSRGYDDDPSLNYHAPDLEPTHHYLAFYHWLRSQFGAQAIVHLGKHGNLEWLPGKSLALSNTCYPEVAFGALPHFYPFIVNDPGEGSQAKRRAQAVILDHLTPPLTRAELYGKLIDLEGLVDEYYEAESLNPSRLGAIRDRITNLVQQEHLDRDLGLTLNDPQPSDLLNQLDGYLCELKEAQIRDGLHIFGQCPTGRQLRDLVVAIARCPGGGRLGLTRAIAQDWGLAVDPLTANPTVPVEISSSATDHRTSYVKDCETDPVTDCTHDHITDYAPNYVTDHAIDPVIARITDRNNSLAYRHVGEVIAAIEQEAARLVEQLIARYPSSFCNDVTSSVKNFVENSVKNAVGRSLTDAVNPASPSIALLTATATELNWIENVLLPALFQTDREIQNLLRGLNGEYVPSGASGAPTRGRPEVLPTGRNFYSVDIRAIPTESAWDVGRKAAEVTIDRYTQEQGDYPQTLGLSVWGTSTMRTGGDDIAEALALLGVRPVWDGMARRVIDFEILPLSVLGRPRVDVTLRISGFFRDAFPNVIDLFDRAVQAVAALSEPADQNPIAARVQQETNEWIAAGLTPSHAKQRASYRIFGSKPGAYGAGLQGLIEAQNWQTDADLAQAYLNWSCFAYGANCAGKSDLEAFKSRLANLQIVLQNQDNREHDLLDSDDYYQFQGGLTAAVRSLRQTSPKVYFGDNSRVENPRVRSLSEEIARVYRSRVINPKWIAGVMRHGYKGAFELAATVDYLFAYDATTNCVEDFMYEGIAHAYLLDETVQQFIRQKNPWALRDIAERLLEAAQRGLWQGADRSLLDQLEAIVLAAEADVENKLI